MIDIYGGVTDIEIGLDNTLYMLIATTPTWIDVGNAAASGSGNQVQIDALKSTPGTITAGEAVYIAGYDDGYQAIVIELAKSDSSSTMPCIGLAVENISDVSTGKVRIVGEVGGIDTSFLDEGEKVYISSATPGGLTSTPPIGPNMIQQVGIASKINASTGKILVSTTSVLPLSDSSPANLGSTISGTSISASRSDHVHAHGNLSGGTMHSVATESTAGFMSASDKIILNNAVEIDGYCRVPLGLRDAITSTSGIVDPSTNNNMAAWAFRDQASDGEARWIIGIPRNYKSGGIGVRIYWSIVSTGGGGQRTSLWEFGYKFLTAGASLGSYSTTTGIALDMDIVTIDDLNLSLLDTISDASINLNADALAIRIARLTSDAGDNFNADIYVHMIELVYIGDIPSNIHGAI